MTEPGLRWPDVLWSGEMRRIGGDIVLNRRFELFAVKPALFNGRSNDDIGIVAFIGPTFCINPSDCLPRTLHVVVDIAPKYLKKIKFRFSSCLIIQVCFFFWQREFSCRNIEKKKSR